MVVCVCNNVKESVIVEAIENGITELDDLKELLGVSIGCQACEDEVLLILDRLLN